MRGLLMQRFTGQVGQLVGVLAGGGHAHRPGPIVVQMAELKSKMKMKISNVLTLVHMTYFVG